MVISLLLLSDAWRAWEHRIGAFHMACRYCGQPSWQLTYRMYQTKGTQMSPPGPNDWPQNERYQVRCATCAAPTLVNHPSTWVPQLLDYVKGGGVVIAQYNTTADLKTKDIGPYPLEISRDRVTDETAEVRILAPDHPLMNTPNKITAKDHVVIHAPGNQTASGDNLLYEPAKNQLLITGNVTVSQGGNIVNGQKLVVDLDTGESHFVTAAPPDGEVSQVPGAPKPGRISVMITPEGIKQMGGSGAATECSQ